MQNHALFVLCIVLIQGCSPTRVIHTNHSSSLDELNEVLAQETLEGRPVVLHFNEGSFLYVERATIRPDTISWFQHGHRSAVLTSDINRIELDQAGRGSGAFGKGFAIGAVIGMFAGLALGSDEECRTIGQTDCSLFPISAGLKAILLAPAVGLVGGLIGAAVESVGASDTTYELRAMDR